MTGPFKEPQADNYLEELNTLNQTNCSLDHCYSFIFCKNHSAAA